MSSVYPSLADQTKIHVLPLDQCYCNALLSQSGRRRRAPGSYGIYEEFGRHGSCGVLRWLLHFYRRSCFISLVAGGNQMMQAIIRYDITGRMDGGCVPAWQRRWNKDTR